MNDNHVPRENRGERVERSELQAGETVVMEWSPYTWAAEAHNGALAGRMRVTVVTPPCDNIAGDAVIETNGGIRLRDYGEGRRYVSGPSERDDMPTPTDIGTGARYYAGGSDE